MPILLSGSPAESSASDCTLCARSGWHIPEFPADDFNKELQYKQFDHWTEVYKKKFGAGLKVRSSSRYPYNCVGMVFASRRALISPDYILKILNEDGYIQVDRIDAQIGDIIVYFKNNEPVHTGIIFGKETDFDGKSPRFRVISKWGGAAEFEHFDDVVPDAYGKQRQFYTDRSVT